jgi:hypothetical protein
MTSRSSRPIRFREYLPEVFRADEFDFQSRFLQVFEDVFEELESIIEGVPGGNLRLKCQAIDGTSVTVEPPESPPQRFSAESLVSLAATPDADTTTLAADYPDKTNGPARLKVQDADFAAVLNPGSELVLHAGGVPDLFNPDLTPPPQLLSRLALDDYKPAPASAFLEFLAGWIGLPLRADLIRRAGETDNKGEPLDEPLYNRRKARWNRHFFRTAVSLYGRRGTLAGVEGMLRAWLKDDLAEQGVIITDLIRTHTDVDTVFQLAPESVKDSKSDENYAQVGVSTVIGEGPPYFFIADLTVDPTERGLRNPAGIDIFQREARFILDTEKPAHTYYQLRVRCTTMQLAPLHGSEVAGEIYAQMNETTLLWDNPWEFSSQD